MTTVRTVTSDCSFLCGHPSHNSAEDAQPCYSAQISHHVAFILGYMTDCVSSVTLISLLHPLGEGIKLSGYMCLIIGG